MERFFVAPQYIKEASIYIEGEDVHHIAHVLRLHKGDRVCVCDGRCKEYLARIAVMDMGRIELTIEESKACEAEPPHRITLYQGIPKSGKMDVIVQKSVELGVHALRPMTTERCVGKMEGSGEKKVLRYQRIADEASKQCGRGILPQVLPPLDLRDCPWQSHDLVLFAYEEERKVSFKQVLGQNAGREDIALVIGPEGGFSEEEAAYMRQFAHMVGLGKRILRTETAGMAALAMLVYALEM